MDLHRLSAADALASLHSAQDGLSPAEAARRLAEHGANRVMRLARPPLWWRLSKEFSHLLALVLWAAAALAFVSEWRDPGHGMAGLGWAILAVILINGLFSFWQEYRAERVLASLEALLPQEVTVLRAGVRQRLPADQIVPGDLLMLQEGDGVPADCLLIDAHGVRVNLAAVTGESEPQSRRAGPAGAEEVLHARNVLLAGTQVLAGEAQAVVFATGSHTEFGKIAHLSQRADADTSPLHREIARLSRWVAALSLLLGGSVFLLGTAVGVPLWASFVFAVGIIVANVPEGLAPTVTLALSMAARRMARRHALVRHLPAVETLGEASVILSDKTGTLTQNRMEVQGLWLHGKEIAPGTLHSLPGGGIVLDIATHCHTLEWVEAQRSYRGDPTELALLQLDPARPRQDKLDELPFDAERRRMCTLHAASDGRRLYCKGALEALLPLCSRMQDGDRIQPLTPAMRTTVEAAEGAMAERGLRVLALAWRPVSMDEGRDAWEQGLIFAGLAGLADPPRAEVPEALHRCRTAGIRVIMITGDHPRTALAVARRIGMVHGADARVVTGEELRRMPLPEVRTLLERTEVVFARLSADQKMVLVEALQASGHIVAVTGDGVNDAPALRAADIGVAMGRGGTEVAREAADLVLLDDNFATIIAAVEEGRAVYQNIRKFLTYILTSNVAEMVPFLAFLLFPIPLPLTVIQILAVDLGTDMLPALALGAEGPHPGLMQEPPRARGQHLLTPGLLARAYLFLGLLEALPAMVAFFHVLASGGWHYGQPLAADAPLYLQATTATLAMIIVMQMVNVFLCRDPSLSAFARGMAVNPLIWLGLGVEFALLMGVVYTPWGHRVFGTAPFAAGVWWFALPFAVTMLAMEEARKALHRWWQMRERRGRAGAQIRRPESSHH